MLEVFKKRRSVRRYKEEDVPEEILKDILEAARIAPSWANKQGWYFIVVKNKETKEKIANCLPEENPVKKGIIQAPVVVVFCGDPEKSGKRGNLEYYAVDVALAIENFCLQAAEYGLGTCIVGWMDEEKIKEILGIPENIRVVAFTPLGYPEKFPGEIKRKELKEIVSYERWNF